MFLPVPILEFKPLSKGLTLKACKTLVDFHEKSSVTSVLENQFRENPHKFHL